MPVRGEGLQDEGNDNGGEGAVEQASKLTYVLHPNCAVEVM